MPYNVGWYRQKESPPEQETGQSLRASRRARAFSISRTQGNFWVPSALLFRGYNKDQGGEGRVGVHGGVKRRVR